MDKYTIVSIANGRYWMLTTPNGEIRIEQKFEHAIYMMDIHAAGMEKVA